VVVDAYTRQFEIPLHLATEEFFEEVHGQLAPGGILALNLGTTSSVDAGLGLLTRIRKGMEASFGANVRLHRVPKSRNWMVLARRDFPFPPLHTLADLLPPGVPIAVGAACLPGQVREGLTPVTGVQAYRDDLNPLQMEQTSEWWREAPK